MTHIDRRAARVLLIDGAGRTLLLHGGDPARPGQRWWFTPGGGLDEGETLAEGAARELFEETGLRVDPAELGSPVWHEVAEFSYREREYRQEQDFFVLRVDECRVDMAGMDDDEQQTITEHRWWSVAEIQASGEQIFPRDLAALLTECLTAPVAGSRSASPAPSSPASSAASWAGDR
ncbi:NUDIX hydrolase [Paractinoplanes rhizophilus]|uniref:NUDIX hydrolase n=1 Tax=Paractinoplanes rhizophilus TaxID=1416877 RepID=A0ABW2HST1_9ACTN|nr:NUDIX domain-containing protein [Actinoplanes sp.]